jgi:alpha-L-arabinofuranosidase
MQQTIIDLHSQFHVGPVDPRVFGGFLEHLGRAIYQGIYDPESRHSDVDGIRTDVLEVLRRLDMTAMRYPGGNFASGYHWQDGVGPRQQRPTVRELAWQSLEPNLFGTDEFIQLCRVMGWTPMLTVNLGTGTPEEARDWVEYCNAPAVSKYANMRAANGNVAPFGVKLWCLGNEMDGPWQLGHLPADQYAIRAQQAAKMMRDVDPRIELVACGSCSIILPTYMEWDRQVLEYIGDYADYISLHRYVGNRENDTPDYLAVTSSIDRQIEETDAVCRFVQAKYRRRKRIYLCFDEWNVWYRARGQKGTGQFAPPILEEVYNLEDALVVAGFLHSFIRHADVVKIANLAQIVNVIAPIMTRGDDLLLQSIYYPFEMVSRRRQGVALRVVVNGPAYESLTHGPTPFVDASAILNGDRLHLFLTNRSLETPMSVHIRLADGIITALESGEALTGPDPKAFNTFEQPTLVVAHSVDGAHIANGTATIDLPPLSFTALTLGLTR